MTTHLELAHKRIARVREELLARVWKRSRWQSPPDSQRDCQAEKHPRQQRSAPVVITMDVVDGHAYRSAPRTVREAFESLPETLRPLKYKAVLRSYYDEHKREAGWGAPKRDDSFDRFVKILQAVPDDYHDKYVWYHENSPYYTTTPPPLFSEIHTLLFAHGVGPKTILAVKHLFCPALEVSDANS